MSALTELRDTLKATRKGELEAIANDLQAHLVARENEDYYYMRDFTLTAKGKALQAIINYLAEEAT